MIRGVTQASLGPKFPALGVETVRRRLQRDLDAVQVAASVIAFSVATLTQSEDSLVDPPVALALAAGLTVVSTLILQSVDPNKYDRFCRGPVTPFGVLLTLGYVGVLLTV
jgi:hypothetical protein